MGLKLRDLVRPRDLDISELEGRWIAVDTSNVLHQFLWSIRSRDGTPLTDRRGNVVSHLIGLLNRSTAMIGDHGIDLVYVFDGKPPELKEDEIERRRQRRKRAEREWERAKREGKVDLARERALRTGHLTEDMVRDAERLLDLLGIPHLRAPMEAEAQCAFMVRRGDVWATNSRDYDALLFGSRYLVRHLTVSRERLDMIVLEDVLEENGVTREQLVDMAILMGTDYNEGIRGVGPKTGLRLIKKHGSIESLPDEKREKVQENYEAIRSIFLDPDTTTDYSVGYGELDEEGIYDFLCDERDLSRDRTDTAVERMASRSRKD